MLLIIITDDPDPAEESANFSNFLSFSAKFILEELISLEEACIAIKLIGLFTLVKKLAFPIILDNLDEFCISFTDKIVFHEKNEIFNKYINKLKNEAMIKLFFDNEGHTKNIVNDYFSKDIMDFFIIENLADKENTKKKFMDENQKKNKLLLNFQTKNNAVFENISCLLFLELISTEIDIDNVISNFRYKDPLSNESKFDLYNLLEKLEDDNLTVCESCNFEKMKNFVSFVNESIFLKWNTELQKRTFNEYFYNN